jgi:nucleoside-diphosphate-sugar epimerase
MSTSTTVELIVIIGAGSIGQAIARRIGVGKTILLADLNEDAAGTAAKTLQAAGFTTSTATVDVASHDSVAGLAETASALGDVMHVVHTAGLSPAQASPEAIIAVDLVGVAFVLEEFGRIIASGGSGIVIASQASACRQPLPHAAAATCRAERGAGQDPRPASWRSCHFCSPTSSPTRAPPTPWPNVPTSCASRRPALTGAIAEPGSTRSALASS